MHLVVSVVYVIEKTLVLFCYTLKSRSRNHVAEQYENACGDDEKP
jgi:hypothetical protein